MAANHAEMPPGTVLVVEDETLVAMFLSDLLVDLGQTVIGPVATAQAALDAAADSRPDTAIVDVNLGGQGSGIELAAELQRAYGTKIIFLSGQAGLSANPDVQAVGPCAVLQKPCLPSDLEAALRAAKTQGPPQAG